MADRKLLVFTDLDGTLLDHETYSYDAALPAIEMLRQHNIGLILASSKTAAEIAPLRAELGFTHCPAIVENGAGLLSPNAQASEQDGRYQEIQTRLDSLPDDLRSRFTGFSQMTVEDVVAATSLSHDAAQLAKQRQFSEPGLFHGTDKERQAFIEAAKSAGLLAKQGGRFLTFSFGGDKAEQMRAIIAEQENATFSIALGDAPNDIGLIEAADIGVIIPNPAHGGIKPLAGEMSGQIIGADKNGPEGWNLTVLELVKKYATLKPMHEKD
ncbi:HAD-IIB family hydrolase [Ahrensia marina]|uniref:Mannosyl-3-phosphoglycerate phosphatase n=1 Tax=Ahrensia marina TaxID=1514904 RepID=A0A0M9GMV1_9HYPH|nr:HAD-IIB family hydrolase [Ahrensia marina]KPB01166.1 mannosyl-3-phosphoglycerate phosphatase [Ahrensia marina]